MDDQLLLTYHDVSSWLDKGYAADVILFEFAKAFNILSQAILLTKLECLRADGTALG